MFSVTEEHRVMSTQYLWRPPSQFASQKLQQKHQRMGLDYYPPCNMRKHDMPDKRAVGNMMDLANGRQSVMAPGHEKYASLASKHTTTMLSHVVHTAGGLVPSKGAQHYLVNTNAGLPFFGGCLAGHALKLSR